jgi:hypothetical protein
MFNQCMHHDEGYAQWVLAVNVRKPPQVQPASLRQTIALAETAAPTNAFYSKKISCLHSTAPQAQR